MLRDFHNVINFLMRFCQVPFMTPRSDQFPWNQSGVVVLNCFSRSHPPLRRVTLGTGNSEGGRILPPPLPARLAESPGKGQPRLPVRFTHLAGCGVGH